MPNLAHVTHNGFTSFGCSCGTSGPISKLGDHLRETGQHDACHGKGCRSCAWTGAPPAEAENARPSPSAPRLGSRGTDQPPNGADR